MNPKPPPPQILPPLPPSDYRLAIVGLPYHPDRITGREGYPEEQVHEYATMVLASAQERIRSLEAKLDPDRLWRVIRDCGWTTRDQTDEVVRAILEIKGEEDDGL